MAGSRKSILMLTNTGKMYNVIGPHIRADGYFGLSDGSHTVQVNIKNFTGGFGLQATLSLNPGEADWFWIKLDGIEDYYAAPYLKFPVDEVHPTGFEGHGDTANLAFNFTGNYTYVRAVVIRDYLNYTTPNEYVLKPGNIVDESKFKRTNNIHYTQSSYFAHTTWTLGAVDNVLICL